MSQVLDYSVGYPRTAVIKQKGFAGGVRYLPKEGASSVRPITRDEFNAYDRQGLGVALVYQHVSRNRPSAGYAAGIHDAQWARDRALEIGPSPRVIYFAVDYDAPASDVPAIKEYARGWGDILGRKRAGAYAKYTLLENLFANGLISWGWQTYAWSPGHNQQNQSRHPRACLFQNLAAVMVDGIACDVNDVLQADWGQHNYGVSALEIGGSSMLIQGSAAKFNTQALAGGGLKVNLDSVTAGADLVKFPRLPVSDELWNDLEERTNAVDALPGQLAELKAEVAELKVLLTQLTSQGLTLGATGQITIGPVD